MSNRNSLSLNISCEKLLNLNQKKIPNLETYCLDYVLSKLDLFNIEQYTNDIKEKLLQRMLSLYQNKFTIKNIPQPQPTIQRVEQLINFETTSHLDLSSINMNKYIISNSNNNNNNNNKHFNNNNLINSFSFLSKCKKLTNLTISGQSTITSDKLLPILEMVGNSLQRLDISKCPRLNDTIIHYISFYCPNLEYLNLEDCIGISGAVFQRASTYDIKNKNNIIKLNNNNTNNNNNSNNISTNNSQNNLNHLNNNSTTINTTITPVFMNKMLNLIELNLSGCKSINPKNLYCLKTAFPSLKMFSFAKNFLSDEDGSVLVQTLPSSLISLDLSFNPIGRLTLLSLVPNSKTNWTSFQLKSLSLGYCRCINAFDLSAVLAGLYKSLEYLSIPGCFQIDKSFLDQILLSPSTILSNIASATTSLANINSNMDSISPNNTNNNNNSNSQLSGISNQALPTTNSILTTTNSNKRKSIDVVALKTLDISYCSQFLSSSTLTKLNQNCKQMKILRYNTVGFNHNHIYSIY
ncbi:hypothetical protein ACTFIU_004199 [Dictyostelium citrinum]